MSLSYLHHWIMQYHLSLSLSFFFPVLLWDNWTIFTFPDVSTCALYWKLSATWKYQYQYQISVTRSSLLRASSACFSSSPSFSVGFPAPCTRAGSWERKEYPKVLETSITRSALLQVAAAAVRQCAAPVRSCCARQCATPGRYSSVCYSRSQLCASCLLFLPQLAAQAVSQSPASVSAGRDRPTHS